MPAVTALALVAGPVLAAAPAVAMFGSFFPSWLICLFLAIVATVLLRLVFIGIGLDDILQFRVPVYMSMALGLTYLLSSLLFGR